MLLLDRRDRESGQSLESRRIRFRLRCLGRDDCYLPHENDHGDFAACAAEAI